MRVGEGDQGSTLAALVRELYPGLSWNKARELVRTGRVSVAGELCFDAAQRPVAGQRVEVDPAGRRRRAPPLPEDALIHVDHEVVVVRKPAGLVTVPWDERDERDSLIERTRVALREREGGRSGERDRLGIVQRLDKETTGLLVFARTRKARKLLEAQFRVHTVHRRYVAIVHGEAEGGEHESALVPDRGDGLRGSWRGPKPPKFAKRALTRVRVEERLQGATLVSCQLETGRQHQIRIHLAEAGHPLVGEQVYDRGYRGARIPADRTMLHAASLGFRHPSGERLLRFEDPMPDDFRAVLESLRHSRAR
nr:pseudouridine synthase [Pseudenhygromyxa sp. WMMC2535]